MMVISFLEEVDKVLLSPFKQRKVLILLVFMRYYYYIDSVIKEVLMNTYFLYLHLIKIVVYIISVW